MASFRYLLITLICAPGLTFAQGGQAQAPTEFLKSTWPLELAQGFIGPHQAYAGTARLARMFLVSPGDLRIGPVAGGLLSDGSVDFIGGVRASYRLRSFHAGEFGSWGNLQARLEAQWCSEGFFLPGGGLEMEVGERVLIGVHGYFTLDPEIETKPGWLMTSLASNLDKFFLKKKAIPDPLPGGIPPIPTEP